MIYTTKKQKEGDGCLSCDYMRKEECAFPNYKTITWCSNHKKKKQLGEEE